MRKERSRGRSWGGAVGVWLSSNERVPVNMSRPPGAGGVGVGRETRVRWAVMFGCTPRAARLRRDQRFRRTLALAPSVGNWQFRQVYAIRLTAVEVDE